MQGYRPSISRTSCHRLPPLCGRADAHQGLAPRWRWAKLTLTYECTNCGAEVTELMTEQELLH